MAFLTVNGAEIELADGRATVPRDDFGRSSRSINGVLTQAIHTRTRSIDATTVLLTEAEAVSTAGLLMGRGNVCSFTADAYSSRGIGVYSGTPTISGGEAFVAAAGTVDWDFQLTGTWTLVAGVRTGATVYYSLDSNGTKYKDGATTGDSVSSFFNVVSGRAQLYGGGGGVYFKYLAAFPFVLSDAHHADITAAGDGAVGDLPDLLVGGTVLRGGTSAFRLKPSSLKDAPVQYQIPGGAMAVGWELAFRLEEVSGDA